MTLFQAILNGDLATTEELLRQGSNPNLVQFSGASAFHLAVGIDNIKLSEDLTKLILQYDGDPNVRSNEGSTPVHTAAAFGHCDNLRLLLLNGGDPFLVDQDGLDALANARGSGCTVCCAIIRQHQEKLLEDITRPVETTSHYTITPYVLCEDHLPHAFGSTTRQTASDPFVSPPHDQLNLDKTSTRHPICHQKPSKWQLEKEAEILHFLEKWQLGVESENGAENRIFQNELRHETTGEDKCLVDHSDSTGSHETFYTCSDNGSVPEAAPSAHESQRGSSKGGTASGLVAPTGHDTLLGSSVGKDVQAALPDQHVSAGGEDMSSLVTDDDSSLGCKPLENNDKETAATITDESVTSSVSFQLPSEYYSSSSDDENSISSSSSSSSNNHVAPPISELARLHLNVGEIHHDYVRCELSLINESRFTEDLLESQLMTEDETELEMDEIGQNDRYAVWTQSVTDQCNCGEMGLIADKGGAFCSPDEKTMLNNFCRSRVNVTPRQDLACDVDVTPTHDIACDVKPRHDNVTPRCSIDEKGNWAVLTPKSNRHTWAEGTASQLKQKQNKNTAQQRQLWFNDHHSTHRTHPQTQLNNFQRLDSYDQDRPDKHCCYAGAGLSAHSCASSKHSHLEKCLFKGFTNKSMNPPGAYPLSDSSAISISSIDSRASQNSTMQYIYTDDEDGYSLLATRFLPDPPSSERIHPDLSDITGDILGLGDTELRSRLASLGDAPGPITPSTRRLYQSRLDRLLKDPTLASMQDTCHHEFLPELTRALSGQLDMSTMDGLEDLMSEPFSDPCASRRWREGTLKTSFNYLLLDPRISLNLPTRHKAMDKLEAFKTFVRAVFYIGKGKRSRPYAHFKEAIQHVSGMVGMQCGAKVQKIVDIWEAGMGVISLHVFQNVIPAEAYTREACIIEAVGLERLTNQKGGECYGPVTTWSRIQRRTLGVHLLHKAFCILLLEGERQIQPHHICVGQ